MPQSYEPPIANATQDFIDNPGARDVAVGDLISDEMIKELFEGAEVPFAASLAPCPGCPLTPLLSAWLTPFLPALPVQLSSSAPEGPMLETQQGHPAAQVPVSASDRSSKT